MEKSFVYENVRINRLKFFVSLEPSKYTKGSYSVTFYKCYKDYILEIGTYSLEDMCERDFYPDLCLDFNHRDLTIENEAIKNIRTLWGHLLVD